MPTRRQIICRGGAMCAALGLPRFAFAAADDTVDVVMGGRPDGSHVWFDPMGLLLRPGQTVRWTNRDSGNSHTTTAYHPANLGRSRRIAEAAKPWDSDYLLPGESFAVTLTQPGVYDYYCQPHEHAGMVGRLVVGEPPSDGWWTTGTLTADGDLPEIALRAFPDIEAILAAGYVPPPCRGRLPTVPIAPPGRRSATGWPRLCAH
ncbi:MAG: plastocyanin/azurin family copper-binding protein, partial [Dehalococcoidia bacterium]